MKCLERTLLYAGVVLALLLAFLALCFCCPRMNSLGFDYMGVIVGILSLLVTILIGWNIYSALEIKQEWETYKGTMEKYIMMQNKRINELGNQIIQMENAIETRIQQLNEQQNCFRHYGYAITDFCQVYTKLEPEKKEYFKTYCKSLSALRNFLKTQENLEWYAPACIENMNEALNKANNANETCDAEIKKDIEEQLKEIRLCKIDGFDTYWEKINDVENRRKNNWQTIQMYQ